MGRILAISALAHAVLLVLLPLLPRLGSSYEQGLEVYEVELVQLESQPVRTVEEPAPEPVEEPVVAPPAEEETEEPSIPDEPTPKPKRVVLKPPARKPDRSLEERLEERMTAEDQRRPEPTRQSETPRQQPAAQSGRARVTASRFPYGWYLQVIQGKVSSNWDQPSARLLAEDSLTSSVSFVIRRDGSVHGITVSRSSGRSTVDQSAAKAVRESAPFPPLPDDYMQSTLEVTIDFTIVRE
jgi:periplasmic protein TonB